MKCRYGSRHFCPEHWHEVSGQFPHFIPEEKHYCSQWLEKLRKRKIIFLVFQVDLTLSCRTTYIYVVPHR